MTIDDYLNAVKERLLTDPVVSGFHIVRERATLVDAHLRARLTLSDGSLLEFSEYVQRSPEDRISVVIYSYHWANANGNLIRRWDNTPHFPDLPGFPRHIHDGRAETVSSGEPVSIFSVLDVIAGNLS
ncbi:MAG: hypothetical protein JXA14_23830 [Anaerolineae bacterium]|nr:hypothetical protein [Anaerolineae bacterium]